MTRTKGAVAPTRLTHEFGRMVKGSTMTQEEVAALASRPEVFEAMLETMRGELQPFPHRAECLPDGRTGARTIVERLRTWNEPFRLGLDPVLLDKALAEAPVLTMSIARTPILMLDVPMIDDPPSGMGVVDMARTFRLLWALFLQAHPYAESLIPMDIRRAEPSPSEQPLGLRWERVDLRAVKRLFSIVSWPDRPLPDYSDSQYAPAMMAVIQHPNWFAPRFAALERVPPFSDVSRRIQGGRNPGRWRCEIEEPW